MRFWTRREKKFMINFSLLSYNQLTMIHQTKNNW